MTEVSQPEGRARGSSEGREGVGKKTVVVSSETYSFLLLCALSLSAVVLFPGSYLLFVAVMAVDGVATLANINLVISIDRSILFLAVVILSVFTGSSGLFLLFLEIVVIIAALDISFLLRRLRGTVVDASVVGSRLKSYAYTLFPAFLFSCLAAYLYSFLFGVSSPDPLALLAVSSTAALFAVYVIVRYLSSRAVDRV